MRLLLTVDDEVVEVTAPVGTTLAEFAAALPPPPDTADARLFVDGELLPPDGVLGVAPALHGAAVTRGPGPPGAARTPGGERVACSATGTGYLLVHPGPRVDRTAAEVVVDLPARPAGPAPTRFPWAVAVVPAVMAVPVAVVLRQPAFLLLGVLAPVAAVLQHRLERRHQRRAARRQQALHHEAVASARARMDAALAEDHARRHAATPPPARVALTASGPGARLWERRAGDRDASTLRLGRGDVPSSVWSRTPGGSPQRLALPDAPVTVDLGGTPVLGLAGPRDLVLGLARALLVQLAVWHSPDDLRLEVPDAAAWWWVRWLPHACAAAPRPGSRTVTVLDGPDAWRHRAGPLARTRPGDCVDPVICVASGVLDLPATCSAVVAVGPSAAAVLSVQGGAQVPFTAETVPERWAGAVARRLAPLLDGATENGAGAPGPVLLADLLLRHAGLDATDPDALLARWRSGRGGGGSPVPLGTAGDDVWWVDLARDGPHALLAGTTGSGKSALLTSWVLGIAALHPPQEVTVLLVDFKGGAAFAALQDLPHVSGVLTDLDPAATRRALSCLTAELRNRERLLTAAGAPDLDAYTTPSGGTGLARLLIVVDEYRVLAEEHPDLLASLVRVATVGRSLGVHLVLATQRPGGVVGADLRANIDLRLALRVADHVDSVDVLGTGDAAQLPAGRPGHGLARQGGELVAFRAALPAARLEEDRAPTVTVRSVPPQLARDRGDGDGPTVSTDVLVRAITAAGERMGPPPAPLWWPPLPDVVHTLDLPPLPTSPRGSHRPRLPFALADRPELQRQDTLAWDLEEDGHLAVVGAPGSGRSGTLRALAAAAREAGIVAHLIAPGPARGTSGVVAGGTGTAVDARDVEHSQALLTMLREPMTRRPCAPAPHPWTLVLIDDWESTVQEWQVDHGRLVEDLMRLVREGTGARLRVAVAGGRSVLTGPGPLLTRRVLLRPADPLDLSLAGVSPRDVPATMPPGRAVVVGAGQDPVEVQVALAAGGIGREAAPPGGPDSRTAPVEPLPTILHAADRRLAVHRPGEVVLGLMRDLGAVGGLAPGGWPTVGAPAALVAGPAGSGRSTTLATVAASLRSGGHRVVTVGHSDRDGSGRLAGPLHFDTDDVLTEPGPLLRALGAVAGTVLVVDDIAVWSGSPAEEAVLAAVTSTGRAGRRLGFVAAAAPSEVLTAFRGLVPWARSTRTGLLLGPHTTADAEVFGVRVPLGGGPAPPGRALLVRRGRAVPLQVALPPDGGGVGGAVPAGRGG